MQSRFRRMHCRPHSMKDASKIHVRSALWNVTFRSVERLGMAANA